MSANTRPLIRIDRLVYHQSTRLNEPVDAVIIRREAGETDQAVIERAYPAHAPIEHYIGWGTRNTYVGCLGHTFKITFSF